MGKIFKNISKLGLGALTGFEIGEIINDNKKSSSNQNQIIPIRTAYNQNNNHEDNTTLYIVIIIGIILFVAMVIAACIHSIKIVSKSKNKKSSSK